MVMTEQTRLPAGDVSIRSPIPVFRIFSTEKATEFYQGFLGCTVDWEHRFETDAPLYQQISRDGLVLQLSEHVGDASPGAKVLTAVRGLEALHRELSEKNYPYMRPAIEIQPWGRELMVTDPFSNRIAFFEAS
jgi:hypothetical protein